MTTIMRQKDIRPAPARIDFKGMKFLITDRPSDANMQTYLMVSPIFMKTKLAEWRKKKSLLKTTKNVRSVWDSVWPWIRSLMSRRSEHIFFNLIFYPFGIFFCCVADLGPLHWALICRVTLVTCGNSFDKKELQTSNKNVWNCSLYV